MPEPDHSAHDGYMNNYHQTGIRRIIGIGREVKGKRKDNSVFPFNLSISEVPLPDRTIYVGVIHDISYQKEAQSRIETLNEQLEKKVEERTEKLAEVVNKLLVTNKSLEKQMKATEAAQTALLKSQEELTIALAKEQELNQLKSRFVSTASHEFRTPLSTILSSAALIARYTAEGTEAKRQRHVDKIKSSVKHLNSILNDFLSIAKLEEGKFSHHPSLFDVRVFISDVIEEISGILKPNQTVSVSYKGDAETCLDQQFFKNILINLISNASKYSDDNTNIEVHSENAQNELTIKVTDHGIGIPLTEQVHLFERFFRAQNAINIQGTGLGLNIVKKYVDLMDGNITFISKENEGTTFIVKLPFDS
jgi:two-component system sensor kinase FixL